MADFDNLIWKDVDDLGQTMGSFRGGQILALEMCVTVKMIARFCHTQQPVDGLQSLVRLAVLVMDAERRGMGNEDIERTPVVDAVQQKTGQQAEGPQVRFTLGMLVRSIRAVADRAAQAADQKFLESDHSHVHVRAAFGVG